MSQPPARPWFRLASVVRPYPAAPTRPQPPAPAPVQQQMFRPPVALPMVAQPAAPPPPPPTTAATPPRTSAPSSPIPSATPVPVNPPVAPPPPRATTPPSPIPPATPAPVSSPVAQPPPRATTPPSPIPPATPAPVSSPVARPPPGATAAPFPPLSQATAPSSPVKTPPPTVTSSAATQLQKSPAKNGGSELAPSITKSPTATPARWSPSPISTKPTSPISKTSSSLPASPLQKVSPKIAATRPDASYYSLAPSPKTKASAPSPSPLAASTPFQTVPSSPAPRQPFPVPSATPITTATARATAPVPSPRTDKPWVETPPQSAKQKLLSHPPSPLTLPRAQLKAGGDLEPIPAEVEQKTILLQETEEKPKTTPKNSNGVLQRFHGEAYKDDFDQRGKRELKKDLKSVNAQKKHSDSEELGIRVVTLSGENKGALMELSPSRKTYGSRAWSNGGQKLKNDSDEGSSRTKDEKHKALAGTERAPFDAFINCNVQGVNNSILHHCSFNHHDPGVHLSVSRKSKGGHGVSHTKDAFLG